MNEVYQTPESALNNDCNIAPIKPGTILKSLVVIFTFLSCVVSFISQYIQSGIVANGVGGGLGPIIFGGLVIGLFQIGKRFRNSRSRYKIFLWCQVVFFISGTVNTLNIFGQKFGA